MVLAALFLALFAYPARAHPFGQRPVAFIERTGTGIALSWVMARDEGGVLTTHLGFGPVQPEVALRGPPLETYFLARVAVETDGTPCRGRVNGVDSVASGYAVRSSFDCGVRPAAITITLSLLRDLDERYITLYQAATDRGIARGAFATGATTARIDFGTGVASASPEAAPSTASRSERIIATLQGQAGAGSLAIAVLLALLLGALHAITPGHGKTITAAYLLGAGGTMRQALTLGGVVAATHAFSVALLGVLAINIDLFVPTRAGPWLQLIAAALIVGLGVSLLRARAHTHEHGGPSGEGIPLRRLAAIGIVGGLVPSPEAIGVVLVAFSLHRWTAGLALVGAFSLGLAVVVIAVAVAAVRGGSLIQRASGGFLARRAPQIAGVVFVAMGVVVAISGLRRL